MRTAASINPVINLSQSLKLALIGLIVVSHACQWCGKVHGIPLQGEWMMKSERVALLWNSDGEVYSLYIYSTRGQKWPIWWRGEHIMHKWLTSLDSKVVFLNVNCNSCDPPWTMFYFSLHKPTQTCRPLLKTSILSDQAQHRAAAGLHSSDLHREVCWDKNFQVLWNKTPPAGPSTVTLQSEVIDSPNTLLFKHHISYAHKHVRMRRMCGGWPWVTATHAGKGGWRGGGAQFLGRCDGAA